MPRPQGVRVRREHEWIRQSRRLIRSTLRDADGRGAARAACLADTSFCNHPYGARVAYRLTCIAQHVLPRSPMSPAPRLGRAGQGREASRHRFRARCRLPTVQMPVAAVAAHSTAAPQTPPEASSSFLPPNASGFRGASLSRPSGPGTGARTDGLTGHPRSEICMFVSC